MVGYFQSVKTHILMKAFSVFHLDNKLRVRIAGDFTH